VAALAKATVLGGLFIWTVGPGLQVGDWALVPWGGE